MLALGCREERSLFSRWQAAARASFPLRHLSIQGCGRREKQACRDMMFKEPPKRVASAHKFSGFLQGKTLRAWATVRKNEQMKIKSHLQKLRKMHRRNLCAVEG